METARQIRLITFRAGPESFVLDIMVVHQILAYSGSTSVPMAPSFIEGIIVVRGEVIPIVDLRARLYPELQASSETSFIIVLESRAGVIGLKVDEVRRPITIDVDAILSPPPIIRGLEGELFVGVIPQGDELLMLIDIEAILTEEEKESLRTAELTPSSSLEPAQ